MSSAAQDAFLISVPIPSSSVSSAKVQEDQRHCKKSIDSTQSPVVATTASTTALTTTSTASGSASEEPSSAPRARPHPLFPFSFSGFPPRNASSTIDRNTTSTVHLGSTPIRSKPSQPVLVRAYSPPPPASSRAGSRAGSTIGPRTPTVINPGPSSSHSLVHDQASRSPPRSSFSSSPPSSRLGSSTASSTASAIVPRVFPWWRRTASINMAAVRAPPIPRDHENLTLPPAGSFSFKNFMAGLDAETDRAANAALDADLDRIAEICARSRYSLSNQYDVHHAPHGSGAAFIAGTTLPSRDQSSRPTTAVTSSSSAPHGHADDDDDDNANAAVSSQSSSSGVRLNRKRGRVGGTRWGSRAIGTTLETILSSNRSSDEERKNNRKRSAAEIAADVRERAAQQQEEEAPASVPRVDTQETADAESSSSSSSSSSSTSEHRLHQQSCRQAVYSRASDAPTSMVLDTSHGGGKDLETRTIIPTTGPGRTSPPRTPSPPTPPPPPLSASSQQSYRGAGTTAILSSISGWITWRPSGPSSSSSSSPSPATPSSRRDPPGTRPTTWGGHARSPAEGSLRDLLRGTERRPGLRRAVVTASETM